VALLDGRHAVLLVEDVALLAGESMRSSAEDSR
jgi:hypothetical protein